MAKRSFFIHVHIPKTAGKTFQSILEKNFPPPLYHTEYTLLPVSYTADQIRAAILRYPTMKAIGSHSITLDLPFAMKEVDVYAISYVRDPVDLFISNYFYAREQPVTQWMNAKTMSLREIIASLPPSGLPPSQLRWLIPRAENRPNRIDQISQLLDRGKLLLFPVSQFDLSCVLLETLFPEDFRDCTYRVLNQSNKSQEVEEEDRNNLRNALSDKDIRLHEMAKDFAGQLATRVIGDGNACARKLAEFARRRAPQTQSTPEVQVGAEV